MTTATTPIQKRRDKARLLTSNDDNSIWVMTTADLDRDNETVDPRGLVFDHFDINPVFVDNHETDGSVTDVILGRVVRHWLDEIGEGTDWPQVGGPKRDAQLCEIQWNTATQKGREAQEMAKTGMLTGGSISFLPLGEVERNSQGGNHYPKARLLEFTATPVGSNPAAVRLKSAKNGAARPPVARPEKRSHGWYVRIGKRVRMKDATHYLRPGVDVEHDTRGWWITQNGQRIDGPYRDEYEAAFHARKKSGQPHYLTRGDDGRLYVEDQGGKVVAGPFANYGEAERAATELHRKASSTTTNRGTTMTRRKWIHRTLKSLWVLKSEGDPAVDNKADQEIKDYIQERGLDDVRVEDKEPDADSGYVEEKEAAGTVENKDAADMRIEYQDGKCVVIDPDTGEQHGPFESHEAAEGFIAGAKAVKSKAKKAAPPPSKSAVTTKTLAADVAKRAKSMLDSGEEEKAEEAVEEAMDDADVPAEKRAKVKRRALKAMEKETDLETPDKISTTEINAAMKDGPDEADLTAGEVKTKDALQDCVSEKIERIINEGGTSTQKIGNTPEGREHAAAIAYSMCGSKSLAAGVAKATVLKVAKAVTKRAIIKASKDDAKGWWMHFNSFADRFDLLVNNLGLPKGDPNVTKWARTEWNALPPSVQDRIERYFGRGSQPYQASLESSKSLGALPFAKHLKALPALKRKELDDVAEAADKLAKRRKDLATHPQPTAAEDLQKAADAGDSADELKSLHKRHKAKRKALANEITDQMTWSGVNGINAGWSGIAPTGAANTWGSGRENPSGNITLGKSLRKSVRKDLDDIVEEALKDAGRTDDVERKKLKRKEVEALMRAADVLDADAEEKRQKADDTEHEEKRKAEGMDDFDAQDRAYKAAEVEAEKARRKAEESENLAEKMRKLASKRGKRKDLDDIEAEAGTKRRKDAFSASAEDLQKRQKAEQDEEAELMEKCIIGLREVREKVSRNSDAIYRAGLSQFRDE